jgi:hypothetical protein
VANGFIADPVNVVEVADVSGNIDRLTASVVNLFDHAIECILISGVKH